MAQKTSSRPRLIQAMVDAFSLPDLRRRLLITFGILVAFRFIAHVPVPGIDATALKSLFTNNALSGHDGYVQRWRHEAIQRGGHGCLSLYHRQHRHHADDAHHPILAATG